MELKVLIISLQVLIDMIDAVCVKARRASLDAVNLVAFFQQQLCEVGPVLPRDTCDQCFFCQFIYSSVLGRGRFTQSSRLIKIPGITHDRLDRAKRGLPL